jgi:CRISPR system Cascade subunit CasC
MKIELHIIQNVAPSNLNRDDTGAPKDAEFGGYRRARLSSQSMKRAMREQYVLPMNADLDHAVRTLQMVPAIDDALQAIRGTNSDDMAVRHQAIRAALSLVNIKVDAEKNTTQYLLFLPKRCAEHIAKLVHEHWDMLQSVEIGEGKKKGKSSDSATYKELINALKAIMKDASRTPEIALFGRMLADEPTWNVDAACQVAHAISVNRVMSEFDFFTAVDDLKTDSTGAGMMGTVQFGSSTFYRYLVVDVDAYLANLAGHKPPYTTGLEEVARISLAAFIEAAVKSLPSGKQNTFAAHNLPSLVMTVVRADAPVSLANAFIKPVTATPEYNMAEAAIVKLDKHYGDITNAYGSDAIKAVHTLMVDVEVPELKHTQQHGVTTLRELIDGTMQACLGGAS